MAVNLETILGMRNLIGMIQSVMGGVPSDLLPPEMYRPSRTVEGNRGTYFKVRGTRQTARIVQYGGPSKARELPGVSEESITLIHAFEHVVHSTAVLQNLAAESQNSPDAEIKQRLGLETISRQIADFGGLFKNLRISAIYSALATGKIYWDADGNLLPSSTGAAYKVDFGIPANQVGTLSVVLGGVQTGWNTTSTDIPGQLIQLKNLARKRTGYPITHAYYGANILGYLNANTVIKQFFTGSAKITESMAWTEIPDGFLGIQKWYPVTEAFFAQSTQPLGSDESGSISSWFSADQVVFTPAPSPDWWEVLEGTYRIPRSFTITKDMMQQIQSLQQVAGPFSYAVMQDDPVSIKHLAGDTFLPIIKVPGVVFNVTVKI
ncbi:MAG TPA: major capsid protein [Pirellulales bacterium]|nr:major capsid protein [Pirellulales bacterium]